MDLYIHYIIHCYTLMSMVSTRAASPTSDYYPTPESTCGPTPTPVPGWDNVTYTYPLRGPSMAIPRKLTPQDFCCRLSVRFEQVQPVCLERFPSQLLPGVLHLQVEEYPGSHHR